MSYTFYIFLLKGGIMLESKFQSDLIKELKRRFTGCVVLKNDAGYIQGIPDLLVLYKHHWAMLECKVTSRAQPNQLYWVDKLDDMSFAAIISPDNKEVVLNELEQAFQPRW